MGLNLGHIVPVLSFSCGGIRLRGNCRTLTRSGGGFGGAADSAAGDRQS